MHGTGTPLGDPIEVSAACAVLLSTRVTEQRPIKLSAAKIAHGHAEAGAGVVGAMQALTSLAHAHGSLLTNLRIVNPYVADTLDVAHLTVAPREEFALVSTQHEGAAGSGISSFAFQGTNAHALVGLGSDEAVPMMMSRMVWSKQSLWLAPRAHPMLTVF